MLGGTALTIGNFDGVHLGHRALVERCRELVGASGRVVTLAFDPHPMTRLNPALAPARLSEFSRRAAWLLEAGANEVERLEPDSVLLSMTAREFVQSLVERYSPAVMVEGADFHFGKGRAGNVRVLAELGTEFGFACDVVAPVDVVMTGLQVVRASSTLVRWLVTHGRMNDASAVLGRPYEIDGTVVQGDRLGRSIGFPTANVRTESLLPADGVYACDVVMPDGAVLPALANVGVRPTVGGLERRLEVHVLREPGEWRLLPGVPEYGWPIRVRVRSWVRDQVKFESVGVLRAQLARDCERAISGLAVFRGDAVATLRAQG